MTPDELNFLLGVEQRITSQIRDLDQRQASFMGAQQLSDARAADALERIRDLLEERRGSVQPVKVESVGFTIDKKTVILVLCVVGLLVIVASLGGEGLRILLNNWAKVSVP